MSVFKDAIANHEKSVQDKQVAIQQVVDDREATRAKFKRDFEDTADAVAFPLFKQFASDVKEMGFPSEVDKGYDGSQNPYFSVEFVPVKGASISKTQRHEVSVYVLKGDVITEKVEHLLYFDQRVGRPNKSVGTSRHSFGLPSINKEVIERYLLEVLSSALKSRE